MSGVSILKSPRTIPEALFYSPDSTRAASPFSLIIRRPAEHFQHAFPRAIDNLPCGLLNFWIIHILLRHCYALHKNFFRGESLFYIGICREGLGFLGGHG